MKAVLAFGGLDMLVLNAGIFPASRKIAICPPKSGASAWTSTSMRTCSSCAPATRF